MFAPPKLTVSSVFTKLKEIATMTGHAVSKEIYFLIFSKADNASVICNNGISEEGNGGDYSQAPAF